MLEEILGFCSTEVLNFFSMHPEASRRLARCRVTLRAGLLPGLSSLSQPWTLGLLSARSHVLQRAP